MAPSEGRNSAVAARKPSIKQRLLRELALFLGLFFFGLVLMPIGIYLVGGEVFGSYGDAGFGGFYGALNSRILGGDCVAWFLVLSPYLAWQILRSTALAWRLAGRGMRNDSSSAA
jgi:hypothetical protein